MMMMKFWIFGGSIWLIIPSSMGFFWNVLPTNANRRLPSSSSSSSFSFSTSWVSPPEHVKLLILPGFGNDSSDYTMEESLVSSLKQCGWKDHQIRVLPVERIDWLQVFLRGCFDASFWTATAPPTRPAFRWYLDRIATEVATLAQQPNERIVLIGHSAGGWLARAALGFFGSEEGSLSAVTPPLLDRTKILGIVTLGTPHTPPPPGIMDMTRGALRLTHEQFPGAYYAPDLFYITVQGLSVTGEKQQRRYFWEPTTVPGFAYNSYEAVCGDGTTVGDGVVPQCAAHLEDAIQVCILLFSFEHRCMTTADVSLMPRLFCCFVVVFCFWLWKCSSRFDHSSISREFFIRLMCQINGMDRLASLMHGTTSC